MFIHLGAASNGGMDPNVSGSKAQASKISSVRSRKEVSISEDKF